MEFADAETLSWTASASNCQPQEERWRLSTLFLRTETNLSPKLCQRLCPSPTSSVTKCPCFSRKHRKLRTTMRGLFQAPHLSLIWCLTVLHHVSRCCLNMYSMFESHLPVVLQYTPRIRLEQLAPVVAGRTLRNEGSQQVLSCGKKKKKLT